MEHLRWILLAIGAVAVCAIYLWDYYSKRRAPRRGSEIIFNQPTDSDLPMTAYDDEPRDYLDAIAGLNKILHNDESSSSTAGVDEVTAGDSGAPTVIRRQSPGKQYQLDSDFFGESLIEDTEQVAEAVDDAAEIDADIQDASIAEDELIILRILPDDDQPFQGLKLLSATKNVGMKFGNMNIFHHYGIGEMSSDKPIFGLANMYEPGEFNLQEMDSFTTNGIVAYMSLPTPIDTISSFELMLNTCQRMADELGGHIKGARGELLDEVYVEAMRNKARRFVS